MQFNWIKVFTGSLLLLITFAVTSCAKYTTSTQDNLNYTYAKSLYQFNNGNLEQAKQGFSSIVKQYPFKEEAIEAQVLLIWIYFLQDDYANVELDLESFLRFYVFNDYTQWARYMQALVMYQQIEGELQDQKNTNDALNIFLEIARTNNSIFQRDSALRIEVIKHFLASRSMTIAKFYINGQRYIAALGRYNEVINYFQDTIFVQEALFRAAEVWLILGLEEEAFKAIATLGYNYNSSTWYKDGIKLLNKYTNYNTATVINKE